MNNEIKSTVVDGSEAANQVVQANGSLPPIDSDFWYEDDPGSGGPFGTRTPIVNESNADRISTVYACVRILAESVASLPLNFYERVGDGQDKRVAFNHPMYYLLHDQPNNWQTSFEFREMMMHHLLLSGNAYAEIIPGERGAIDQIVPIHPSRVEPYRIADGSINYSIGSGNTDDIGNLNSRILTQDEVFHLRFDSTDGLEGRSVIEVARVSFQFSRAIEEHGLSTYENDATPGGVLSTDVKLEPKVRQELRKSWEQLHAGPRRKRRVAVLDNGLKWIQVGMSLQDAQWLESMKFSKEQICGLFRVPPHMVAALERSTNNNIEHQSIEFVVHSLRPWLVRWEQAILRDLVVQKNKYFAEFLVDGLLRGDSETRSKSLELQFRNGAITLDEWRAIENRNKYPDGVGNRPFMMMNMMPIDRADDVVDARSSSGRDASADGTVNDRGSNSNNANNAKNDVNIAKPTAIMDGYSVLISDCVSKIINAYNRELEKRIAKRSENEERFTKWLGEFLESHGQYANKTLGPICESFEKITGKPIREKVESVIANNIAVLQAGFIANDAFSNLLCTQLVDCFGESLR